MSDTTAGKMDFFKLAQMVILVSFILYFGRTLFIPLSFAVLISCILYPVCAWLEKKRISRSLSIVIAILLMIISIASVLAILVIQVKNFSSEWSILRMKLLETYANVELFILDYFRITIDDQHSWIKNILQNSGSGIISLLGPTAYSIGKYLVLLIIIPILSALLLYYRNIFVNALCKLFPPDQTESIQKLLHEVIITYYNFIKGMILVYLIVGVLNSIGLAILGVPYPVLFGFIASILTFIPYVGILVASLLPITISWITYNSIWYPIGVILVFSIVQYLEANVIFPFVVSSRLKINAMATILAILAGGIIWGGAGMILFIPFIAILKLIADKTENLRVLSDFLGVSERKINT